jgi:uncharacterized protein (DUF302 family)
MARAFEKTVTTEKSFDEAVAAVERKAGEKGFRVLHVHDVAATLAEKGYTREPLKIVEVCNARYASLVLAKDVRIALMLPCPISVHVEGGRTYISTMLTTAIGEFFPSADIDLLAAEIERTLLEIVTEAA